MKNGKAIKKLRVVIAEKSWLAWEKLQPIWVISKGSQSEKP